MKSEETKPAAAPVSTRDVLQKEYDVLMAEAAPLRKRLDELNTKMAPMEAERHDLTAKLKKITMPRQAELETVLRALS